MGVDTILFIILWLVILVFLLPNIEMIIFGIGVLFGAISSLFNMFAYVGASCSLINTIENVFIIAWLWFVLIAFYHNFFKQSW